MGFSTWLYQYRVTLKRESFTQDANGVLTSTGWTVVATDVPCYKEANPNVTRPSAGGRVLLDNWLAMDVWHFEEGFDIRADDAFQNTTVKPDGIPVADHGNWWRVRGAPQAYASLGVLALGRTRLLAFPLGPTFDGET